MPPVLATLATHHSPHCLGLGRLCSGRLWGARVGLQHVFAARGIFFTDVGGRAGVVESVALVSRGGFCWDGPSPDFAGGSAWR